MRDEITPVLWLCGPPGVGKSTVAWQIYAELVRAGRRVGYVDIDQLGICYPAPTPGAWAPDPASDPGRHRMQARNLGAVVANFRAAGAERVVVSGVVDAVRGVDVELIPRVAMTVCRLRCDPRELRRRIAERGYPDEVDAELAYADALDRNAIGDVCVDTTGLTVADAVQLVGEATAGWVAATGPIGGGVAPPAPGDTAGTILWLCGATAVGKSTVGWRVWDRARQVGAASTAYVDLDQIGFLRPVPADDPRNHRVKAANLAAVWRTFRAAGADRLVVVGPVDDLDAVRMYAAALPGATWTLCRLHAGPAELTKRVLLRGQGEGPPIAGDELKGQPEAVLRRVAAEATAHAEALDRAGIGHLRVDTGGRTVEETVDLVVSAVPFRRSP